MGEYVIAGLAILGVIGCIIAFIKTPAQHRYRLLSPKLTLEAQIASYPASDQSVHDSYKSQSFSNIHKWRYSRFSKAVREKMRAKVVFSQCPS